MSLVLSGAIVFFVGLIVGFIFAIYGFWVLLDREGYIFINNHIQKKSDLEKTMSLADFLSSKDELTK